MLNKTNFLKAEQGLEDLLAVLPRYYLASIERIDPSSETNIIYHLECDESPEKIKVDYNFETSTLTIQNNSETGELPKTLKEYLTRTIDIYNRFRSEFSDEGYKMTFNNVSAKQLKAAVPTPSQQIVYALIDLVGCRPKVPRPAKEVNVIFYEPSIDFIHFAGDEVMLKLRQRTNEAEKIIDRINSMLRNVHPEKKGLEYVWKLGKDEIFNYRPLPN